MNPKPQSRRRLGPLPQSSWSIRRASLAVSLAAAWAFCGFSYAAQDATQGRLARPDVKMGAEQLPAMDGRPAAAGRIPEGTSQAAADLWNELTLSLKGNAAPGTGPRSFELEFEGRVRTKDGSNDYTARFGYLDLG
ncbi:MAG: hypothetical protein AAGG01_21460, partial [Planctomycetota bacterium]